MGAEDEPRTIGELGRRITELTNEIRDDRRNYLALAVWEVEKAAMARERADRDREIGGLRRKVDALDSEKETEHKELMARIAAQRDEIRAANDQARKDRGKVWLAIGLSILGGIVAIITGVTVNTLNQAITGFAGG